MHQVNIKVFCIGKTQAQDEAIASWLKEVGVNEFNLPETLTGAESVVGLAAKRCYMSFEPGLNPNVTRVRKNWHDYFENILKSGHGSVLEHAHYSYAIEGVTRVFTGELNRHRAGVGVSEGSMRYIRFDDIPYWRPLSITLSPEEFFDYAKIEMGYGLWDKSKEEQEKQNYITAKVKSQRVFEDVFNFCEEQYKKLCDIWNITDPDMPFDKKKQLTSMFRRIIPMGVSTGGVWTFNLRALRHIIALRTSPHAEEEIAYVFSLIAKDIVEKEPSLFCDFEETFDGWIPKYEKI